MFNRARRTWTVFFENLEVPNVALKTWVALVLLVKLGQVTVPYTANIQTGKKGPNRP